MFFFLLFSLLQSNREEDDNTLVDFLGELLTSVVHVRSKSHNKKTKMKCKYVINCNLILFSHLFYWLSTP